MAIQHVVRQVLNVRKVCRPEEPNPYPYPCPCPYPYPYP